jgi:hypothetical protein
LQTVLSCAACGRSVRITSPNAAAFATAVGRRFAESGWIPRPDGRLPDLWCGDCARDYEQSGVAAEEFQTRRQQKDLDASSPDAL